MIYIATYIRKLKDRSGNYILPATRASGVYFNDNSTLQDHHQSISIHNGYSRHMCMYDDECDMRGHWVTKTYLIMDGSTFKRRFDLDMQIVIHSNSCTEERYNYINMAPVLNQISQWMNVKWSTINTFVTFEFPSIDGNIGTDRSGYSGLVLECGTNTTAGCSIARIYNDSEDGIEEVEGYKSGAWDLSLKLFKTIGTIIHIRIVGGTIN